MATCSGPTSALGTTSSTSRRASDETLDALSPRLALVSHPTDRTAIKFVAGQAFRAPSPYEYLYSDGGYTQARPESLDPETVRTGEAEVTQRFSETASVIVAGYYNQILGPRRHHGRLVVGADPVHQRRRRDPVGRRRD